MSSTTMKDSNDHSQFVLNHSNKLNLVVKKELIDKDIAVENVIRRLRQKRNIEVKKVKDVGSKLKRISPMVEKKVKSEIKDFDGSNPSSASLKTLRSDDRKSIGCVRNILSGHSLKPKNFLEIEDDEIEDYLEIDQNVVEDLEALIPEEEIVSISNSLIQPEDQPVETDDAADIETKPDNTGISKVSLSQPIPDCDSRECKDFQNESHDLELKIKRDVDVEGKSEIQQNDDLVCINSPKDDGIGQKSDMGMTINNNNFETETKIQETLENMKKPKTSHDAKNLKEKNKKMPNKKPKQNVSGNSRKITDFFNPDSVKNEIDSAQQIIEIKETDDSHLEPNSKGYNSSTEVIHLEEEVIPIRTRTLRSSSKVSQLSKTKELQEEISTFSEITHNSRIVDGESKKDLPLSPKIESPIEIDDDSELGKEEVKNELTMPESPNFGSKSINESKSEITKSKHKKKSKKINKKNKPKTVQSEVVDDIPEDERIKAIEVTLTNSGTNTLSEKQSEEAVDEAKDRNENHLILGSSSAGNEINPSENQQIQRKKRTKIQKKKVNSKVQKLSIAETSNTIEEAENEPDNSPRNNTDEKQGTKRKRKTSVKNQHKTLLNEKIPRVVSEDETIRNNDVAKLEIYDFDDKSNEEIETLKKPVKNRKQPKNQEMLTNGKRSRLNNVPGQDQHSFSRENIELENINNNVVNASSNIIESSSQSELESSTESQEDFKLENKDNISLDFAATTPDQNLSKGNTGSGEVTEDLGLNWKPSYGPYKRVDRCNVCLLAFKSYKKLRAHKKVHEVENPYKCNKCGDSFEDVEKLAAHLRIHKGKMPFSCKKCDATFWTSFQLDKHQLVHVLKKAPPPSKPPSKVFKCEECGKEFKKICDLERHTRVHTGEKPSVCNICNKRFQQPYNLNKHLYTHTQEKNFECVICQKKFGRNDVLNRHVLTHSIVKPFRCSVCSRTFIRNSQLKLHFKKHHGQEKDAESETSNNEAIASTSAV